MKASSETGYYLIELTKLLIPLVPIAITLLATILLNRAAPTRHTIWLRAITSVWLLVALASRIMLTSAARSHAFSGGGSSEEAFRTRMGLYFTVSSWLFILEQVMFILFAIVLFLLFRAAAWLPRELI
jgi:hypothetical protein